MGGPTHACGRCGTPIPLGKRWCQTCYAAVGYASFIGPPPAEANAPPSPVGPRSPAPGPSGRPEIAPAVGRDLTLYEKTRARPVEPIPKPTYSRWRGGGVTFGPGGRVAATVVIAAPILLVVRFLYWLGGDSLYAPLGFAPFYLIPAGLLLWNVWRRDRVDEGKTPWRASITETSELIKRERAEKRAAKAALAAAAAATSPSESPAERPRSSGPRYVCSVCGTFEFSGERFCPNCMSPASRATVIIPSGPAAQPIGRQYLVRAAGPPPRYSRWHKTPSTLAPLTKIAFTALVLAACVGGYPLAVDLDWTNAAHFFVEEPAWVIRFSYLVIAIPVGAGLLIHLWRRGEVGSDLAAPPGLPATQGTRETLGTDGTQDGPVFTPWDRPVPHEPLPAPVYSRWRGGSASFGPVAKVLITGGLAFFNLVMMPAMVWALTLPGTALFLRELWKRERVA